MAKEASNFYYLGQYEEAASQKETPKAAPFILAAKSFRGEHLEARRLYDKHRHSFSIQELVFSDFHLGLSYTRTSDYDQAQTLFVENWKRRHHPDLKEEHLFFIYQGLSFFRFFFSQHRKSLAFAHKAYREIMNGVNSRPLLMALVCDLIAHNYFQLGQAAKGESYLTKAYDLAKKNGLRQLEGEFRASLVIYRSHFELRVDKSLKNLKRLLVETPEDNDYTRSELVLQMAKLYYLKGSYQKANDFLVQNFKTIYKNDNKRKVAKLNTLLAQLMIPRGQFIEALSLCKVAKASLNHTIDSNLLAPVLGVEIQLLKLLNQDYQEQEMTLKQLLRKSDKAIMLQIHERENAGVPLRNEQDQVGVFFDRVHAKEKSALEDLIRFKLLHLVTKFFGPFNKKKVIVPHPKSLGLFLIDEAEVLYQEVKLSSNMRSFLMALRDGPQSKESLIRRIWGYQEYDPFRHDHLIYSLVRRTRNLLGPKAEWIQTGEELYGLAQDVEFYFRGQRAAQVNPKKELYEDESLSGLNFRQLQILEGALEDGFKASDAGKYFKVTRMTAYRDICELVELGFLHKKGQGRGTCYLLR